MKALSIRQPWAKLILEKRKTIEIRSWNTKFRGYFLIHASRNVDTSALETYGFSAKNLLRGYLLGYANLIDVIIYESEEEFLKDKEKHLSIRLPNRYPVYGFVLDDVNRIKPIEHKGKLGFFDIGAKTQVLTVVNVTTHKQQR
ncbi:MAG: ASCH domain-containing protein [Nanoarchaeota archaeon]|nr:ASCH domain-containing protein [Nanoarchaeota archaeon]